MKKKKLLFLLEVVSLLLFFIITLIVFIRRPKNYNVTYDINNISVEETFNKAHQYYEFKVTKDDIPYSFIYKSQFLHKKKLIDEIKFDETNKCLFLKSDYIGIEPICYDDSSYISYDLIENKDDEFYKIDKTKIEKDEFKNIDIYRVKNNSCLIWASKGYYYISKDKKEELMFLNNDSYYNNLSYQVDEFVITPNYDEEYSFSTIYIINLKNGKIKKWDIEHKINFNSYYLGDKDGIIYLFDKKEKHEYAINPRKRRIEIVDDKNQGKIWNDGWENVSTTKLTNQEYKFLHKEPLTFSISDSKLKVELLNFKNSITLTNKVDKIVSASNNSVFYLIKNELYEYSFNHGEELLMSYNEWNFNQDNTIFIYKNK